MTTKKYRSKLDDRTVSFAAEIIRTRSEDESFGCAAQMVAKAAMQFLASADTLMDACRIAAAAPSDDPLTGSDRKRIEMVYTSMAAAIEEALESDLVQPIELLSVIGIEVAPDPEEADGMKQVAEGIGICVDGVTVEEEETAPPAKDKTQKLRK